jgi:endonuclease YncB( thermonuclease family)
MPLVRESSDERQNRRVDANARPVTPHVASERPETNAEAPASAREARTYDLSPPYVVLNGLTFRAGDNTIRIADAEGPDRHAVCLDRAGVLWACGLRARAAFNNLIGHRPLRCERTDVGAAGEIIAKCVVDGRDVASALTAGGWARPLPASARAYDEEAREAERAGHGLWNGNWRMREQPAVTIRR